MMFSPVIKINLKSTLHALLLIVVPILLISCDQTSSNSDECDIPVSQQIDNLILSLEEGEEINKEDRNRIYDLAFDLNEKYKGEMSSDEIIEVVE